MDQHHHAYLTRVVVSQVGPPGASIDHIHVHVPAWSVVRSSFVGAVVSGFQYGPLGLFWVGLVRPAFELW